MNNKRSEAKIIKIKDIYSGTFVGPEDQQIFSIRGISIPNVRIYGSILANYKNLGENQTYYSFLLDDGTDTIYLKHWVRHESSYNPDLDNQIINIKSKQIVDIVGKVREYQDQYYITPVSINLNFGIEGEIHRRLLFLQNDIELHGLLDHEVNSLATSQSQIDETDDLNRKILSVMSSRSSENTVENLALILDIPNPEIKKHLNDLLLEGLIYNPKPNQYKKIEDD